MNDEQIATIQTFESFSAFLSFMGCSIVLFKLLFLQVEWKLTTKQIAILSFIDFFTAIFFCIGRSAMSANLNFCKFQSFMIQWGSLCNVLWISAMSYHLHHWVALRKNEERINKKMRQTATASICGSFLVSILLLVSGVYGRATLWCWIKDEYQWVRFIFFYGVLVVAWVYVIYILREVGSAVSGGPRLSFRKSARLALAGTGIQQKIQQYIFVFVFTWFFGLLNRSVEAAVGHPVFATSLLHALFVPLQGFLNSLVYGGLLIDIVYLVKAKRNSISDITPPSPTHGHDPEAPPPGATGVQLPDHNPRTSSGDKPHPGPPLGAPGHKPQRRGSKKLSSGGLPHVPYIPRKVSIFMSSFNQGEAPMSDLEDVGCWLLDGHDIYVIGVQECLCLEEFRNRMHSHLGGPDRFQIHTCEIGSSNTRLGFHGFIALTVFVKTSDIEQGFIKMTESSANDLANGTDLIVTTAANKGAVGLPFQIHDTSIGFVTVHLPSDSKGKSKLPRRNAAAQEMLREVVLASEDVGCDMQLQHDHLVILGDLNYRMNTPPVGPKNTALSNSNRGRQSVLGEGQSALLSIASAAFAERSALGDDPHWVRRKYGLFYGPESPMAIPPEERELLQRAEKFSASHWDAVIQYDEMIEMMKAGEVFFGFREVPPRFPPTYKRKKGLVAGDCGDYTSFSELVQGYSHTGEEANEVDEMDDSGSLSGGRATVSMGSLSEIDESLDDITGVGAGAGAETKKVGFGRGEGGEGDSTERGGGVTISETIDLSTSGHSTVSSSSFSSSSEAPPAGTSSPVSSTSDRPKPNRRGSMFNIRRGSVMGGGGSGGGAAAAAAALEEENKKKEEKRKSKLRPPSYTDRIIVHSLQDNGRLVAQGYGFCDSYRASDHRPVCMAMTLEVNSAIIPAKHATEDLDATELSPYIALLQLKVKGLQAIFVDRDGSGTTTNPLLTATAVGRSGVGGEGEGRGEGGVNAEDIQLRKEDLSTPLALSKRLSSPSSSVSVSLSSGLATETKDVRSTRHSADSSSSPLSPHSPPSGAPAPAAEKKKQRRASMFPMAPPGPPPVPTAAEVVIVFPLPAKDPLIEYRKMYNFIKAFQVGDDSSLKILKHRNAKLKNELLKVRKSYPWKQVSGSHEIEVDGCADVSLGVDALLKIIDTNGDDMGQAHINLNPFLSPEKLDTPHHLQVPISSGGQYRGTLTGTFTLKCLQDQLSLG